METISKFEDWLNKNIYSTANDFIIFAHENNIITFHDIDNIYESINRDDFDSDNDYENALEEQTPKDVFTWYLVSSEAYDFFNKMKNPVVKIKELYFWGRCSYNQSITRDFEDSIDIIKTILF